jgi:hypothetical protein
MKKSKDKNRFQLGTRNKSRGLLAVLLASGSLLKAADRDFGPAQFHPHVIESKVPGGYALLVTDINNDTGGPMSLAGTISWPAIVPGAKLPAPIFSTQGMMPAPTGTTRFWTTLACRPRAVQSPTSIATDALMLSSSAAPLQTSSGTRT